MALYIDVEPVVKQLTSVCLTDDCFGMGIQMGVNHALEILAKAPIVEAEPVVHAHWEQYVDEDEDWGDLSYFKCSACGTVELTGRMRCPECGAHMDEEVAE